MMREGSPPLGDQIASFCDDLILAGRSAATVKVYRHFVRQLTDADPRAIILRYLPASAETAHAALCSFAKWQVDQGYAAESMMARIPRVKGRKPPPRPFLSPEQVRLVYNTDSPPPHRLMIRLLLTGLRVSEMCGARYADLRGDKLTIRGKGGVYRTIVLDGETLGMLWPAIGILPLDDTADAVDGLEPPSPTLFAVAASSVRSDRRRPQDRILPLTPNSVRSRLRTIGRRLAIPNLSPHSFRRTFASQSLLAGMDSLNVRTLGGWTDEAVFKARYSFYVLEDAALDASRALGLTARLLDAPHGPQEPAP